MALEIQRTEMCWGIEDREHVIMKEIFWAVLQRLCIWGRERHCIGNHLLECHSFTNSLCPRHTFFQVLIWGPFITCAFLCLEITFLPLPLPAPSTPQLLFSPQLNVSVARQLPVALHPLISYSLPLPWLTNFSYCPVSSVLSVLLGNIYYTLYYIKQLINSKLLLGGIMCFEFSTSIFE